jgi:uncharacterized protein YkwD
MAANNFLSHTGSDGLKLFDRVVAAGFPYASAGAENIYGGGPTFAEAMAVWQSKPGACSTLMAGQGLGEVSAFEIVILSDLPTWDGQLGTGALGVGYACVAGSDYPCYWTLIVGGDI